MGLFYKRESLYEVEVDGKSIDDDSMNDFEVKEPAEDNTEGEDTNTEENNNDQDTNNDDSGDDNQDNEENSDNDQDTEEINDDDFEVKDPDDEGKNEEENNDDSGDDTQDNEENSDNDQDQQDTDTPQINKDIIDIENKIYDSLSEDQKKIRILQLKIQFKDLYEESDILINSINNIPKTNENIDTIHRLIVALNNSKTYLSDYLIKVFDKSSFWDNNVIYVKYIEVFRTIKRILDELNKNNKEKL